MLERIYAFGIDVGAARIGHGVENIEARFAGAQWKEERVAILRIRTFGNGRGIHRLAASRHGLTAGYRGAFGNVELQVVLVHLGTRWLGVVDHGESALDLELALSGLEAHDVGDDLNTFDLLADIVDFDFHRGCSRRSHAVIGDFLMDDADEVWALGIELEAEVALRIGLGASGFFHALTEAEEDDVVSGSGLAGGGVLYGAGEGLGGGEGGEEEDQQL